MGFNNEMIFGRSRKLLFLIILMIFSYFNLQCQKKESESKAAADIDKPVFELPAKGPYFPVDERIIEDRWKVIRFVVPLKRYAKNPILVKETPLEAAGKGPQSYGTVLYDKDDGLYKLWYTIFDLSAYKNNKPFSYNVCYAESKDGLTWNRPDLGLFTHRGTISPHNNAISLGREKTCGIDVEFNPYPHTSDKKFIAIHNDSGGVFVSYSANGKKFNCSFDKPAVWYHSDTHNNFIYDEVRGRWLMYVRPRAYAGNGLKHVGRRRVAVKRSVDLKDWTKEETILVPGEDEPDYFYGIGVFRRGDLFFGQLQIYETVHHHLYEELIWSGDGIHWSKLPSETQRIFLNVGPKGAWDAGMVILFEKPVLVGDEMRFYYAGTDLTHNAFGNSAVGLATTKKDRLIGVKSIPDTSGRVLTRPITINGNLFVNAQAKGGLRVEIRSAVRDETLPGWSAEECTPFKGDQLNSEIRWGDKSLNELKGQTVRIRFQLNDGVLYSFDIK